MDTSQPLTHLEARVLAAIERHIRAEGVAPTIAELAANLRLKSKGTVHRYVQSLIAKGKLERHGNGWRGLRIVGLAMPQPPSNVKQLPTLASRSLKSNKVTRLKLDSNVSHPVALPAELSAALRGKGAGTDGADALVDENGLSNLRIPLLGRIAAGQPIEAIEDTNYLDLAAFFIGPDRYALRVSGESMIDVGILDGDTVILRKQSTARAGDIVVALIDSQEATLKRLGNVKDGMVELIPENSTMKTMHYAVDRVSFQGVLVGQLRSY
ncbi:MAG: LexA family protein [Granulosicoccus sp.]